MYFQHEMPKVWKAMTVLYVYHLMFNLKNELGNNEYQK